MYLRSMMIVVGLGLLGGCGDGQPLFDESTDGSTDGGTDGSGTDTGGIDGGVPLPPGTDDPSASSDIVRYEDRNDLGGGLVTDVSFDAGSDTFTVDGLGFDGANVYARGDAVRTMNGFRVFDADVVTEDSLTGLPIGQIVPYRAILGLSTNDVAGEARTSFAIVRTGGYVDYGFGGFIYERNGEVVLPTSGQARFAGDYAGVRVFTNRSGLEFTRGDMEIAIDFNDFNANDAVIGSITNREAFTTGGDSIPTGGADELALPNLNFVVQEGSPSINSDGELSGGITSSTINDSGALETYEEGTYYGIIAGDMTDRNDGGEIVGVIVIESDDPRFDNVTAQETGGFILYRPSR